MFIEKDLVMLPTKEKAKEHDIILLKKKENISSVEEGKLALCVFPNSNDLGNVWETQHLYILSDEEIKEGDWCYDKVLNIIFQTDKYTNYKYINQTDNVLKIIATTDKSLKVKDPNHPNILPDWNLLQIPETFIEYFIFEYNKGNIITKVMVEYERKYRCRGVNFNSCLEEASDKFDCGNCESYMSLKINSDNTIKLKI